MYYINLQLFSEETAVTAPDTQTSAGQPEQAAPPPAAEETFESATGKGGRWESDYKAAVSEIVRTRLKGAKENEQRIKQMQPIIDLLGKQYGVEPTDLDGIIAKLDADTHWYEQEAMEKGVPVNIIRDMRSAERKNAYMQQRLDDYAREDEQRKSFQQLSDSFQRVTAKYPAASLSDEINNKHFMSLISNGFDPLEAYESAHFRELQQATMQYAMSRASAEVQANANRPRESALGSSNGVVLSADPKTWTKEQRNEIRNRVRRGEKITLP